MFTEEEITNVLNYKPDEHCFDSFGENYKNLTHLEEDERKYIYYLNLNMYYQNYMYKLSYYIECIEKYIGHQNSFLGKTEYYNFLKQSIIKLREAQQETFTDIFHLDDSLKSFKNSIIDYYENPNNEDYFGKEKLKHNYIYKILKID